MTMGNTSVWEAGHTIHGSTIAERAKTRPAAGRRTLTLAMGTARACLLTLARHAGRAYVAGDRLEDGLRVAQRHIAAGRTTTLGYFNEDGESPRDVADRCLATVRALAATESYVSIKLPALAFSSQLLSEVAQQARLGGICLHIDAMWPATAPTTMQMIERTMDAQACGAIGIALPGRWHRSVEDARWATRRRMLVRVVKGQWPDPHDRHRDLRRGYMEVIRALAGREQLVRVAGHDLPLAEEATDVLTKAGTPCELELLHGLPMPPMLAMAKSRGLRVRVYVPFGSGHLPYAIGHVIRNPRLAWRLVKQLAGLATS